MQTVQFLAIASYAVEQLHRDPHNLYAIENAFVQTSLIHQPQ